MMNNATSAYRLKSSGMPSKKIAVPTMTQAPKMAASKPMKGNLLNKMSSKAMQNMPLKTMRMARRMK